METAGGNTGDGSGDGGAGDSSSGDSEDTSVDFSDTGVFSWIAKGFENVVEAIGSFLNFLNPTSDKFILKDVINGLVAIRGMVR